MRNKILSLLVLLLTAASGAWAQGYNVTFGGLSESEMNTTVNVASLPQTFTAIGNAPFYPWTVISTSGNYFHDASVTSGGEGKVSVSFGDQEMSITITGPFEGTATIHVTGEDDEERNISTDITVSCEAVGGASTPDVEVTTNAASEGATFTEASFAMPAFDATAEYELVRDMGYKVAFSGVPTRARLAKDGDGKFHFADGLTFQLLDNIDAANPKDITSAEGITFMVGEVEAVDIEGHTFYQLNKETLVPLADFLADAQPGLYAIRAVASNGEYDGIFTSDVINLFQGYEVEVAAKEFVTYFRDEPLYADPQTSPDAELYTLSKVEGDQVVLSSKADVIPSNVPMLVYNNSDEDKTFLLIPADEEPVSFMWLRFFVGTLEPTTIPASTANLTNYALNGKQFVWVKDAIEMGDHKAWLSIENSTSNARALNIVFEDGETTGITNTNRTNLTNGVIYDLSGRKVNGQSSMVNGQLKKGVYVINGRKVVK